MSDRITYLSKFDRPTLSEQSTCYACKEESAELRTDDFYLEPVCLKCLGEIAAMGGAMESAAVIDIEESRHPIFDSVMHQALSGKVDMNIHQLAAVLMAEQGAR